MILKPLGSPGSPGSQPQTKQWMGARGGVGVQEQRAHTGGERQEAKSTSRGQGGGEKIIEARVLVTVCLFMNTIN